jgi:hypothetical protein
VVARQERSSDGGLAHTGAARRLQPLLRRPASGLPQSRIRSDRGDSNVDARADSHTRSPQDCPTAGLQREGRHH